MLFKNLFNSSTENAKADSLTTTNPPAQAIGTEAPKTEKTEDANDKRNYITIAWGTGYPIDVIYDFIHKNFEEDGYRDALVNGDGTYREAKEKIITNDLKMLFRRVSLRYQDDLRMIDVQIARARESFITSSVMMLEAKKKTFEEHITEISKMARLLDEGDPKMTTMIETYRRGFFKGIAASTQNMFNNH